MRAYFFGAEAPPPGTRAARARAGRALPPPRRSTSATATASWRLFRKRRHARSRSSSTAPRSRRTTGRRASRSPTSTSTPAARSNLLRGDAPARARRDVHLHCSTNKVYGDTPNALPLRRARDALGDRRRAPLRATASPRTCRSTRCLHSVFGASKVAADVMVQEYGRYFGMRTACFRGGTLTGPQHSATELHGFLGYVMRCTLEGTRRTRSSATRASRCATRSTATTWCRRSSAFFRAPRVAEVYNIGGGRHSNTARCSRRSRCVEQITGRELDWTGTSRRTASATTSGGSGRNARVRRPLPGVAPGVRRAGGSSRRCTTPTRSAGTRDRCRQAAPARRAASMPSTTTGR